jgi:outer membrane protein
MKQFTIRRSLAIGCLALVVVAACSASAVSMAEPLTLDKAVEIAFDKSPRIKIALDEIAKSKGGVESTAANFRPKLNADITHMLQGPAVTVTVPGIGTADLVPAQNTTGNANVALPIDISRQLSYAHGLSKLQFEMSYLSLLSTSEQLIYDVKKAYFDLLRAQGGEEVAKASLDSAQANLSNTRAKFDVGVLPKFDVSRAETEEASLSQQLISAGNAVRIARAALNNTLGLPVDEPTEAATVDVTAVQIETDLSKRTEQAFNGRPEIKMAEKSVQMGQTGVKLAKTGNKPTLAATANYNYNFKASGFSSSKESWNAIFVLGIPIWDGGQTRASVMEARADESKARNSLEEAKLGVGLDVKVSLLNLQDAADRMDVASKNVSLAEESLRLAKVRYDAGISTLVEVTDAETASTQARIGLVNAKYDYATALAGLEKATATQPEVARLQLLK